MVMIKITLFSHDLSARRAQRTKSRVRKASSQNSRSWDPEGPQTSIYFFCQTEYECCLWFPPTNIHCFADACSCRQYSVNTIHPALTFVTVKRCLSTAISANILCCLEYSCTTFSAAWILLLIYTFTHSYSSILPVGCKTQPGAEHKSETCIGILATDISRCQKYQMLSDLNFRFKFSM